MGNVVNLNRFRKKKVREEQKKRAETNRRLHGRTKAERLSEAAQKSRLEKLLGGARLVPDGERAEDDEKGPVLPVEP